MEAMMTETKTSTGPFIGPEHGVEDQEDDKHRDRNDQRHALIGPFLACVFAGPLQVISGWQFDVISTLPDGLFHRGA